MNGNLNILIGAKLRDTTETELNKAIDKLSGELKEIKLKVDVNVGSFESFSQLIRQHVMEVGNLISRQNVELDHFIQRSERVFADNAKRSSEALSSSVDKSNAKIENSAKKAESALKRVGSAAGKANDEMEELYSTSMLSGEGYDDLSNHVSRIRNNVDQYAKVVVETDKNTKELRRATIEYRNELGLLVKEQMAWRNIMGEDGNPIARIFDTTGLTFADDMAKANQIVDKFESYQIKQQQRLSRLFANQLINGDDKDKLGKLFEGLSSTSSLAEVARFEQEVSRVESAAKDLSRAYQTVDSFEAYKEKQMARLSKMSANRYAPDEAKGAVRETLFGLNPMSSKLDVAKYEQDIRQLEQSAKKAERLQLAQNTFLSNLKGLTDAGVLPSDKIQGFSDAISKLNMGSTKEDIQAVNQLHKDLKREQQRLIQADKAMDSFEAYQIKQRGRLSKLMTDAFLPKEHMDNAMNSFMNLTSAASKREIAEFEQEVSKVEELSKRLAKARQSDDAFKAYQIKQLERLNRLSSNEYLTGKNVPFEGLSNLSADSSKEDIANYEREVARLEGLSKRTEKIRLTQNTFRDNLAGLSKVGVLPQDRLKGFEKLINTLDPDSTKEDVQAINRYYKELRQEQQRLVQSSSKTEKALHDVLAQQQKFGRNNGVRDEDFVKKTSEKYEQMISVIEQAKRIGKSLGDQEIEILQKRLKLIDDEIYKQKELEKEQLRTRRLGTKVDDVNPNFFDGTNDEEMRRSIAKSYSRRLGKGVDESAISIKRVIDPSTRQEIIKFFADIEDGNDKFIRYSGSIDRATQSMYEYEQQMRSTHNRNLSFLQQFGVAMERVPVWTAATTAFFGVIRFFVEGVRYVNEFNKSMTEVAIVTGQTQEQVEQLGMSFHAMAYDMSVNASELAKSAVEFYRQGLSQAEVYEKMKVTNQYAKTAALDAKESAEILTATTNSMGVSAQKAADTFSYLGDATATGASEIGKAFQRVGGSAGALKLDFDKVSSWIATVSSRTREGAETIGNSIKSILARVQNLTEKGFDEDGTNVNYVARALKDAADIDLTDATGNFRNFGDVMDELGARWSTLNSRQKAYLATTVAGSYQQSRFMNLMEGYGESVKLYEQSLESAGTTQEKFMIWQEGNEAHIERMKTAWQTLWMKSFNSESIRTTADILTGIGNTLTWLVDKFGLFNIIAGATAIVFLTMTASGKALLASLTAMALQIPMVRNGIVAMTVATQIYTGSAVAARVASAALTATLGFLSGGLLVALTVLVGSLAQKWSENYNEQQKVKMLNEQMIDTWKAHGDQIDALVGKYERLKSAQESGVATASELQELTKVSDDIANLLPSAVDDYDVDGNARLKNIELIKEEIALMKEQARLQTQGKVDSFGDTLTKNKDKIEDARSVVNDIKGEIDVLTNRPDPRISKDTIEEMLAEKRSELILKQQELNSLLSNEKKEVQESVSAVLTLNDGWTEVSKSTKSYFNEIVKNKKMSDFSDKDEAKKWLGSFDEQVKAAIQIEKIVKDASKWDWAIDNADAEKDNFLSALHQEAQSAGLSMSWLSNIVKEYLSAIGMGAPTMDDFSYAIEEFNGRMVQASEDLKPLNNAIDKLNSGHKLAYSDIQSLTKNYPELMKYMKTENGQLVVTAEALNKVRQAKIQEYQTDLDLKRKQLEKNKQYVLDLLKGYGVQIGANYTLAQAKEAAAKAGDVAFDRALSKQEAMSDGAVAGSRALANAGRAVESGVYSQLSLFDEYQKQLDEYQKMLDGGLNFDTTSDKQSKDKEGVDALTKALRELDYALKEIQNRLNNYPRSSQAYRDELQKQIELLKQKKNLIDAELKSPTGYTFSGGSTSGGTKYSGSYADTINSAANKYGVDPNLLAALIKQESGFRQLGDDGKTLKSPAGALGLAQLMPATAKELGVDPHNAEQNIMGGAKYLAQQLNTFGGDIKLALAAYNAGASRAQEALDEGWKETTNYVSTIMGNYQGGGDNIYAVGSGDNKEQFDKVSGLKDQLLQVDAEIAKLTKEIFDSKLVEFDNLLSVVDNKLKASEVMESAYGGDDQEIVKNAKLIEAEINKQIGLYKDKQKLVHEEAEAIRASGYNTDEYNQKVLELGNSWWDYESAIENAKGKLEDLNETQKRVADDLSKTWIESAESAADTVIENLKKAIEKRKELELDAIEEREKAEEERHKAELDRLDEEYKANEKIINAKLKSLDRDGQDDDYVKQLSKEQQELANIEKKIAGLELAGDRPEIKAKREELEKQRKDQQEKIDKMTTDRNRDMKRRRLQDDLESYKEDADNKKKQEDEKNESTKDSLEKEKEMVSETYDLILENEKHWNDMRKQIISGHYDDVKAIVSEYIGWYETNMQETTDRVKKMLQQNTLDMLKEQTSLPNQGGLAPSNSGLDPSESSMSPFERYVRNGVMWWASDDKTRGLLNQENEQLRQQYGFKSMTLEDIQKNHGETYSKVEQEVFSMYIKNKLKWVKESDPEKKAELALANSRIRERFNFRDYTLQEILADPQLYQIAKQFGFDTGGYTGNWGGSDGRFALLHQKEIVLNKDDTSNILKAVDLVRGLVGISVPNLNGLFNNKNTERAIEQPISVEINIEKFVGDEKSANGLANTIVRRLKGKGVN